jgi:transposase
MESIAKLCLLPELKVVQVIPPGFLICEKVFQAEVCPRCANLSKAVYDHRWVHIRDTPLREKSITLKILKRRFSCKPCRRPFTEPIPGILPGRRTTQRFRLAVKEACKKYTDLSAVKREFRVSYEFIYSAYYEGLKLDQI